MRELTLGHNSTAARFGVLSLLCAVFSAPAFADMGTSAGDTAWILTATALVLFMTLPGLALFYGGLVQAKNLLEIANTQQEMSFPMPAARLTRAHDTGRAD